MASLDDLRAHAADIQQMIGNPPDDGKLYIYRRLVADIMGGEVYSVTACAVFVPATGAPFAQVQRPFEGDELAARKLTHGPYVTATELAVFLGLQVVPSEGVAGWLRQEIDLPQQTAEGLGFPAAEVATLVDEEEDDTAFVTALSNET